MTIRNVEIAEQFNKLADLLEIAGENPFRIRAYRNAARTIDGLAKEVSELLKKNTDLTEIPNIGKDLAGKIQAIVKTGEFSELKKMQKRLPPVLGELLSIEGLGPKRVQLIYRKLKIKTIEDLKKCIASGKLRNLRGMGQKTEERIAQGLLHAKEFAKRYSLSEVAPIVDRMMQFLKKCKEVKRVECAGSFRRKKESVGDLDFVVATANMKKVMDHFVKFDEITSIISKGTTRSAVRLRSGIQVDLRAVSSQSYGAALFYFTGSKAHNIAIRKIAQKMKLKINEYGVFKGKKNIASKTEEDIYRVIGLKYIAPELREDKGEIELAKITKEV